MISVLVSNTFGKLILSHLYGMFCFYVMLSQYYYFTVFDMMILFCAVDVAFIILLSMFLLFVCICDLMYISIF